MHIAYLTTEYPPHNTGGIGTSIQNLGRELVRQGHRVTVLGIGSSMEWNDEGVHVKFLGQTRVPKLGWFLNRLQVVSEINRLIADDGLEIVEAPDWMGLSAGMKLNCPLVIRCNGSDTYFGSMLGYRPRWSTYLAEKIALSQANQIVAVTRFAAERTRTLFKLKKDIDVIPNGVNTGIYFPDSSISEDDSLILYYGSLIRKKGILDLAKIFTLVAAMDSSVRLLMVGRDSADRQSGKDSTWDLFQQLATPYALQRIEYLGAKPANEFVDLIRQSAVCVFPSYAETFGLAWAEAMACGKAVIASNIGWANEIIENGVSGVLIHPVAHKEYADAIVDLLNDPNKRKHIGQNARERVKQLFSIQRVAKLSLDWYSEIINAQN